MTMRNRVTIDPQDIIALEYECGRCHSRQTAPLAAITNAIMNCPNCGCNWIKSNFDPATSAKSNPSIPRFVQFLKELYNIGENGPDKDGAKIRLELKVGSEGIRQD